MRKTAAAIVAASILAVAFPAEAVLRDIDVGNYYFEEVATGARNPITAQEGDQLRFTVREGTYPPHDVVIEGYGPDYQSGQLVLFERFTTPPLNKPGTFPLFCRAHRNRGHETRLVVKAKASSPAPGSTTAPPKSKPSSPGPGPSSPSSSAAPTASASASAAPSVAAPTSGASLAPVGVDVAPDRRRASPDANSLAGLMGHDFGGDEPWTTAFWLWLLAALPIFAATGYAIRREMRRQP